MITMIILYLFLSFFDLLLLLLKHLQTKYTKKHTIKL